MNLPPHQRATSSPPLSVGLSVDGAEFGGAEISLVNLVTSTRTVDPSVTFTLIGHPCPALFGLAKRLPDVPLIEVDNSGGKLGRALAFRRTLRSLDLDILQVTLCNPTAGLSAQLGGILSGTPTIAIEQLVRPIRAKATPVKAVISRLLVDHAAVGTKSASDVESYGRLRQGSVRVIHNGVPVPADDEPVRRIAPSDMFAIGTVGRLVNQKGIDRLIPALKSIPDCHLTIVGAGRDADRLADLANDNGLGERVAFVGWDDAPGELIRGFDLFVLASRNEAFPLTIVEALLRDRPVVATNVGSVADAIQHGSTGLLVDYTGDESLSEQIRTLMDRPGQAADLATKGREYAVEHFSSEAMAHHYIEMWRQPRGRLLP